MPKPNEPKIYDRDDVSFAFLVGIFAGVALVDVAIICAYFFGR